MCADEFAGMSLAQFLHTTFPNSKNKELLNTADVLHQTLSERLESVPENSPDQKLIIFLPALTLSPA